VPNWAAVGATVFDANESTNDATVDLTFHTADFPAFHPANYRAYCAAE
jgi:hypothetical protein